MVKERIIDLAELFLSRKMVWNIDATLKMMIRGFDLGALSFKGKIEYILSDVEEDVRDNYGKS